MIMRICDNLLYELSESQTKLLEQSGQIIDSIVLYGAYVVDEIREREPYVFDHNTRIMLMIIMDVLEKLDSVGVLLKNGCTEGLIPIQRAIIESYFSIMFIFAGDFEEKIIAYDVCHINERILAGKKVLETADSIEAKKIKRKIKELQRKLSQTEYKEINCIWADLYKKKKYPPAWYKIITDKCFTIKEIAEKSNGIAVYDAIYGYYSKSIHGTLALKSYVCLEEEAFKIKKFRSPEMVDMLCKQNLIIISHVYEKLIKRYLNEMAMLDYRRWYLEKREEIKVLVEIGKKDK